MILCNFQHKHHKAKGQGKAPYLFSHLCGEVPKGYVNQVSDELWPCSLVFFLNSIHTCWDNKPLQTPKHSRPSYLQILMSKFPLGNSLQFHSGFYNSSSSIRKDRRTNERVFPPYAMWFISPGRTPSQPEFTTEGLQLASSGFYRFSGSSAHRRDDAVWSSLWRD